MSVDIDINTPKWSDLEKYIMDSDPSSFPIILSSEITNTKLYPVRYIDFKTRLGTEHDNGEYENTLSSFQNEINKLLSDESNNIDAINEIYDNIIVLTKHGKGHIESVIKHASAMTRYIENNEVKWRISPFESFILLCAIQIHDLGNKYGREKHATSFLNNFKKYAEESFIVSNALKDCIYKIARAHSGKIEGDNDTIEKAQLQRVKPVDSIDVNQQFLAAILRFSDELADDQTRVKNMDNMPEFSKIYHSYSAALHTARIVKHEKNATYSVELCYCLDINEAVKQYKKVNEKGVIEELKLLDEIFNRTVKMERERRYCSRYFYPHLMINETNVKIDILSSTFDTYIIEYTLPARGYPIENICIPDRDKYMNKIIENISKEGLNSNEQE
jgi:hypothetical protein